MLRLSLTLITIALLSFACTEDKMKSASPPPLSPDLTLQAVNGECLDLEAIVRQMEETSKTFPGFVFTHNFEVLSSGVSQNFHQLLIARSFKAEETRARGVADLHGAKQTGCEQVVMPDAGGLPLTYKITDHSPTHLELQIDPDALKEPTKDLSDRHAEVIRDFHAVQKILIRILTPTRVQFISTYRSIPMECPKVPSLEIRENLVYSWVATDGQPDASVDLEPAYAKRLMDLAPGFTLRNQERASQDRVTLDAQSAQDLLRELRTKTYAPCR
jgi:hypothetical protein